MIFSHPRRLILKMTFFARLKLASIIFALIVMNVAHSESTLRAIEKEFIRLVNRTGSSIVEISTFKADNGPKRVARRNVGSGIIVSKDGYILTTRSVVGRANKVRVKLGDESLFDGKVVGTDGLSDLALVKVEISDDLPLINFGNSDNLDTGSWVVAMGRSVGDCPSVSLGIVEGRDILPNKPTYFKVLKISGFVSPGNSGGAIVDMDGNLVGIIVAAISEPRLMKPDVIFEFPGPGEETERFRFHIERFRSHLDQALDRVTGIILGDQRGILAIPINYARKVMEELKERGKVERGWLGVQIDNIDSATMKRLDLNSREGVVVTQVLRGSPAFEAGIEEDDVIISVDGKKINNVVELSEIISNSKPQTKVELTIIRDKQKQNISVKLGKLPGTNR